MICLRKHAIDWGQAYQATEQGHPAQQEQVIVVCGWLPEVELVQLSHLSRNGVVKVEKNRNQQSRNQGTSHIAAWNLSHLLQAENQASTPVSCIHDCRLPRAKAKSFQYFASR